MNVKTFIYILCILFFVLFFTLMAKMNPDRRKACDGELTESVYQNVIVSVQIKIFLQNNLTLFRPNIIQQS